MDDIECNALSAEGIKSYYYVRWKEETLAKEPLLKCPICSKEFRGQYNLSHHTKRHKTKENKEGQCNICGFKGPLKEHMKVHATERKECNVCGNKCGSDYALKKHIENMHVWNGVYKFKCLICEKSFKQAKNLE